MSWSTLDWTELRSGLDYSLSGSYCNGLPGSRLRTGIHVVEETWICSIHSQTPLGTRLGG